MSQPCVLLGSYQGRPGASLVWGSQAEVERMSEAVSYSSFRESQVEGRALVSDAIWGWPHGIELRANYAWVAFQRTDALVGRHFMANHDMAYNVLFSDGSVKTFSDAGLSLFKDYARMQDAYGNGNPPRPWQIGGLFVRYFDNLYAQD